MYRIELGIAAWRLSRMLVREEGPFRVFSELRERTGIMYDDEGHTVSWPDWNPLHCVYCTSVYVAALLCIAPRWVVHVLAISGFAAAFEELSMRME